MAGPQKLILFALVSSLFLGLLYGNNVSLVLKDPFNGQSVVDGELTGEEETGLSTTDKFKAAGICALGAGAAGLIAAGTFGAGIPLSVGIAAGACAVGAGSFLLTKAENNPFEEVPILGQMVGFSILMINFIGTLFTLMTFGIGTDAPLWARFVVGIPVSMGIGWYIVRIIRGI